MAGLYDHKGVAITVGCRVRQRNIHDSGRGALPFNAGQEGTVVDLGRTRAGVQFDGRTAIYAFRPTDEPKVDRVRAEYLEVVPPGIRAARTMADHADPSVTEKYINAERPEVLGP